MINKLFRRDTTLWSDDLRIREKIAHRLGWIDVAGAMRGQIDKLKAFAEEARAAEYSHVVLLGMGGSSLGPLVLRRIFGVKPGYPDLRVLDTTDPLAILDLEAKIEPRRTLFIVASKSGTTVEPLSLYSYFNAKLPAADRGKHFVAVTDAGTPLSALAERENFRAVYLNPADIGGRYSVLSYFGLVPAALIGIDLERLLAAAVNTADLTKANEAGDNPALKLGAYMADEALAGRDKLTLLTSPTLAPFGLWIEQLIAESTGKSGTGVIPVAGEPLLPPSEYGPDRFFVAMSLNDDTKLEAVVEKLRDKGRNVLQIKLDNTYDLGAEFWRWEAAVAICGAKLGINPFDEPNVAESKENTNRLLEKLASGDRFSPRPATACGGSLTINIGEATQKMINKQSPGFEVSGSDIEGALKAFLNLVAPPKYLALLAYWPETEGTAATISKLRKWLSSNLRVPVTSGYGPRYLHSTGQEHKGGPPTGIFIQLTAGDKPNPVVPGQKYGFAELQEAQARGDFAALENHGRPVMEIRLDKLQTDDLIELQELFSQALNAVTV